MPAMVGAGGGGIEQSGKRTHGHGQQCDDCRVEGNLREVNDNEKKYNKNKFKKENLLFCIN